jgi:hypothetical protein
LQSAIAQAKAAAGDRYVSLMAPRKHIELETVRVVDAPGVTHLRYRVVR